MEAGEGRSTIWQATSEFAILAIRLRSSAKLSARRTRTSLNGGCVEFGKMYCTLSKS